MEQIETWEILKTIPERGFLISNFGRIFNVQTKKFLSPHIHKSRCGKYLRVNIGKKKFMVHVLVAKAFVVCFRTDQTQVDHIDRNTLNCNAHNLRWVSPSENIHHFHQSRTVKYGNEIFHGKNK